MDEVLKKVPNETFTKPQKEDSFSLRPVLRGKWQGGISNIVQNPISDPSVPYNSQQEILTGGVHSILFWLNKDYPRGEQPEFPALDPQFERWEYPIRIWAQNQGLN